MIFRRNKTTAPPANVTPARTVTLTKDSSGAPAVSLTKVREAGHIDLAKRADKAGISLSKRNLAGIRAQAVMVLDHSGSMWADYQSGKVQTLVDRALAFALQIDVDGTVPVIPFDSRVWPAVEVTIDNYQGVVNNRIWQANQMATTNLAAALDNVRAMAAITETPIYCLVVTDGNPDNRQAATDIVIDLARYPVFVKFVAIRDVPYLNELDDLPAGRRLLDNVDAKSFPDPAAVSDLAFADAMVDEWDTWMAAAQQAGILT